MKHTQRSRPICDYLFNYRLGKCHTRLTSQESLVKKKKRKKRQPSGVSTPNIVSTRYHVQQVLEGHTAPSLHLQSNPVFRLSHPDINQSLDSYNEIGL